MRTTFINTLILEARQNPDIFLLCGDLGYSVLEPFASEFPDRFLNVGIAEQNMMQIAAGLALEGYKVFVYSIGNFPTLRCMEQIRYDVCYHNLDVKVVAVGAGYAYGPLSTSHHTTEDLAMLRSIPGMVVTAPSDPKEAEALTRYHCQYAGPGYLRINKAGEPILHKTAISVVAPQILPLLDRQDCETVVISTGAITESALSDIEENSLGWALWSMPFVNPVDRQGLIQLAKQYQTIITLEEHQLNAGAGSAIIETLMDAFASGELQTIPKVHRIAIPNTFQHVAGSQQWLRLKSGLKLSKS
ncbi:transketolase family protein [Leeia oryzae]|uniref:transketolase family protein n=1 Tax=Leeia oryzae TaxID=356662 RepID=UPI00036EE0CF|nr:transketolase C-terminal domain-containing protein [Leeia oryzae]